MYTNDNIDFHKKDLMKKYDNEIDVLMQINKDKADKSFAYDKSCYIVKDQIYGAKVEDNSFKHFTDSIMKMAILSQNRREFFINSLITEKDLLNSPYDVSFTVDAKDFSSNSLDVQLGHVTYYLNGNKYETNIINEDNKEYFLGTFNNIINCKGIYDIDKLNEKDQLLYKKLYFDLLNELYEKRIKLMKDYKVEKILSGIPFIACGLASLQVDGGLDVKATIIGLGGIISLFINKGIDELKEGIDNEKIRISKNKINLEDLLYDNVVKDDNLFIDEKPKMKIK